MVILTEGSLELGAQFAFEVVSEEAFVQVSRPCALSELYESSIILL